MSKQLLINGGIFVAGAGLGFGTGYLVYKKKYERISEEEIESVREAYAKNAKPKPNLSDLVQDIRNAKEENDEETVQSIVDRHGYTSTNMETDTDTFRQTAGRVPTVQELIRLGAGEPIEDVVRNAADHDDDNVQEINILKDNLFDNPPDQDPEDLDDGVEDVGPRGPERPYVIETVEWYTNNTNYDQVTLVYWADDEVLVDDAGRVIHEVETVVGNTNLHRFGFLSDNVDIVYVRNEKLKVDYEITKDERNYSEVVHHVAPEGNEYGTQRRMRSNDE